MLKLESNVREHSFLMTYLVLASITRVVKQNLITKWRGTLDRQTKGAYEHLKRKYNS